MTFQRTQDLGEIREVLTRPECYSRMANDDAPAREAFQVADTGRFSAILAIENGVILGVFIIVPTGPGYADVHFCLLPETWGRTQEIGEAFIGWCWRETSLQSLTGQVPAYNALALRLAKACGFEVVDLEVGAVQKHGITYDRYVTRISRPA